MFIIKVIKFISGKLNGLRLRFTRLWLQMQGVELGKNVYIGNNVNIQLAPKSRLKIGNNVSVLNYTSIFVNPGSVVEIGDSTFISHHCEIASSDSIIIASECAFAAYCTIIDTDKDYIDMLKPMPLRQGKTSPVKIEDNVWLAYKVTVLRGVILGKGCVIGANAVVTKSIPPYCMAAGVPAKVLKRFDEGGNDLSRSSC